MSITYFQAKMISSIPSNLLGRMFPLAHAKYIRRKSPGILDEFFFSVISKLDIKTLIECGANDARASKRVTQSGRRAIAIEANPVTYEKLTQKDAGAVEAINVGLSDTSGELEFYVPKGQDTAGDATFAPNPEFEYDAKTVPTRPLDDIMSDHDGLSHDFALWIDVEGFQRQVLDGGKTTFSSSKCKLIKIEVESEETFEGQILAEAVDDRLHEFGFIPVFCDREYDHQFNVVYMRKSDMDHVAPELLNAMNAMQNLVLGPIQLIRRLGSKRLLKAEIKNMFGRT